MARYIGPGVGAKSQIGFSEEGAWGSQQQIMTNFVEMTGEGVVSEIGALVSKALRSDRAVHKRVSGIESAGGPVSCEVAPSGFESWFKHALGLVETTRLDNAFIIKCEGNTETTCELAITHTDGVATALDITMGVGANLSLDLTSAAYDTIGEVMAAINAHDGLACYSPYDALSSTWTTSIQDDDYLTAAQNSNCLEECSNIDILSTPSWMWTVGTEWDVFSHAIKGHSSLPEGMSVEVGRDVAAFLYAGAKVNTMELTAEPNDFFMSSFNLMAKGGTTVSSPTAVSTNTGNAKNAFKIRYTGANATASLAIDSSNYTITLEIDGTTEDIVHNINEPYVDPSDGRMYNLQRLGGLVEYLNDLSYIDCQISDYASPYTLSTTLNHYPATSILSSDYTVFNFEYTGTKALPVLWGDYIGSDLGDSVTFYAQVVTGGVPGTATIYFKKTAAGAYGNLATTSATVPTSIRTGANVDSGFTIFFPDDTELQSGDTWSFETIRPSSTAVYADVDPFSGFEGSLTVDGVAEDIMGWSCTINNNLYGDKYHLGQRTRAKLPEQKRNTEGSMNLEFDHLDAYRRFINNTSVAIAINFLSAEYIETTALGDSPTQYELTISQPNVKFNGTTPVAGDESLILTDFPYVAMWDDVNDEPDITITVVSNVAYV